jgi:hypothetical protein
VADKVLTHRGFTTLDGSSRVAISTRWVSPSIKC